MHIETVDPFGFAEQASSILNAAWAPPCIAYSPEYLRWQFAFPGQIINRACAAFEGDTAIGFVGTSQRRAQLHGQVRQVAIVSFAAVLPDYRGRGALGQLYAHLLPLFAQDNVPIVTFALVNSAGERGILKSYPLAGYTLKGLGNFPGYSHLRTKKDPPEAVPCDLSALQESSPPGNRLWKSPDDAEWAHYRQDPRESCVLQVPQPTGSVVGRLIASPVRAPGSMQTMAMLDALLTPAPTDGTALKQLLGAPKFDGLSTEVVSLPNVSCVDPTVLRSAGIRQTSPGFVGFVASSNPNDAILEAAGTNLEIT